MKKKIVAAVMATALMVTMIPASLAVSAAEPIERPSITVRAALRPEILEYLIELADNAIADGTVAASTPSAQANFYQCYYYAKGVYADAMSANPTVTQETIDNAVSDLLNAFHYLA